MTDSRKFSRFAFELKRHLMIQINTCLSRIQCSQSSCSIKNYDSHNFTPKLDLCRKKPLKIVLIAFDLINMSLNDTPFKHSLINILNLDHYLHKYRYCWSAPLWDRDFVRQFVSIFSLYFHIFPIQFINTIVCYKNYRLCDGHGRPPNPTVIVQISEPNRLSWIRYGRTEVIEVILVGCHSSICFHHASHMGSLSFSLQ